MARPRRSFSTEFKQEAASLVLDQGYSVPQASRSLDVGETALRRWVDQLRAEDGNPKKDKGFSKPNSEAGPKYSYGT